MSPWLTRFFMRLTKYSGSGISTYALDLALVAVMIYLGMNYYLAIAIGYTISVSLNYVICHRMVYFGTTRDFWSGYAIFMCLAMIGMGLILGLVYLFLSLTGWDVLIVRTIVAVIVGFCGFLINTFYNFRLL